MKIPGLSEEYNKTVQEQPNAKLKTNMNMTTEDIQVLLW